MKDYEKFYITGQGEYYLNENEEDRFKSSLDEHSWFMEREKHSCVWKDKCKSYEWLNSAARSVKDTTT